MKNHVKLFLERISFEYRSSFKRIAYCRSSARSSLRFLGFCDLDIRSQAEVHGGSILRTGTIRALQRSVHAFDLKQAGGRGCRACACRRLHEGCVPGGTIRFGGGGGGRVLLRGEEAAHAVGVYLSK